MDDRRFDGLTRALANGASRRSVVKAFLGLGVAGLAPLTRSNDTDAARRPAANPTPIPKCPGIQVWSNGQCGCPSGVKCGPDCCASAAQCCDNACCSAGTICTGEEVCCPQSQVCGGVCCGSAQGCCEVDGCCDGVCVSNGTCCTTGNICSAANGDACCAPGQDCCATADPICIDRAAGGCCIDSDCTGLTDICNTGICDPTSHRCVAEPVTDGKPCGTCVSCIGGVCPPPCDSPLLCCGGTTCVDPASGGCCATTDCPASTDSCVVRDCQKNQCVDVPAITCPSGQKCQDGKCVCANGNGLCGDGDTAVCCDTGETCQMFDALGSTMHLCCPDGMPACVDLSLQKGVCCSDGCQEISLDSLGTIDVCCAGELCAGPNVLTCCPSGQTCSELDFGNFTAGICCDDGHAACFDQDHLFCCGVGETCTLDLSNGRGICCATEVCEDLTGHKICCEGGSACKPLTVGGNPRTFCCPAEPCLNGDQPICCDTGETCQSIEIQNHTVYACCAGEACITEKGIDCCGAGESCKTVDAGPGLAIGACCAEGIDACLTVAGKPVCCAEAGFTCQAITVPGAITVDVCCDGPPCAVSNGVVCCNTDQICDPTHGCVTPN